MVLFAVVATGVLFASQRSGDPRSEANPTASQSSKAPGANRPSDASSAGRGSPDRNSRSDSSNPQVSASRRQTDLTRVSFDGDARSDLAIQGFDTEGEIATYVSNGDSFAGPRIWGRVPFVGVGKIHRLNGDFDGDGRTDVAALEDVDGGQRVSVRRSAGNGFEAARVWGHLRGSISDETYPFTADADGDGLMDLVLVGYTAAGVDLTVLRSNGLGFDGERVWRREIQWDFTATKIVPGDFNADGRTDVAAVQQVGGVLHPGLSSTGIVRRGAATSRRRVGRLPARHGFLLA